MNFCFIDRAKLNQALLQ